MAPFKLIGLHQHAEITPTHSVTSLCHVRGNHPRTLLTKLDSPPRLTVYTAYPFLLHSVTTHAVPTRGPHTWAHCSSSWYKRRPPKPRLPSWFKLGQIYLRISPNHLAPAQRLLWPHPPSCRKHDKFMLQNTSVWKAIHIEFCHRYIFLKEGSPMSS